MGEPVPRAEGARQHTISQGYLYFAGRDVEWLRVDGENFVGRPIEEILRRHPEVVLAAVYGVPDPDGGDRVMVALIVKDGATFDPARFQDFLATQADLISESWRCRRGISALKTLPRN